MTDGSGVELLEGESEAEYVARQTRLREEAAARMRAKFGASGGLSGRLGGIGSDSYKTAQTQDRGVGSDILSSLGSGLSGLGSATAAVASAGWSASSWLFSKSDAGDIPRSSASGTAGIAKHGTDVAANENSGAAERDPHDISDLLGACAAQSSFEPVHKQSFPESYMHQRAGSRAAEESHLNQSWGAWDAPGRDHHPDAQETRMQSVAMLSRGGSVPRARKIAASKSSSSWDDFETW
mmetsp:Transcript_7142/g.15753  ORF Transcript_7142/g.15753 Transcript_7142/m.15753 type:complete len:238 (-) Transcript_7142:368-1081(-)